MKDAFEEFPIANPASLLLDLVDTPRGPGMHWRIHIAERPFVSRQLPVRMHVPFAQQEHELLFSELGINQRERHAVKRQVPGRVPRILPFIRHRDDIGVVDMFPIVVATIPSFGWRRGRFGIAIQPLLDNVVIVLLGPEQPA